MSILRKTHKSNDYSLSDSLESIINSIHTHPCLWIRGILPSSLAATSSAPQDNVPLYAIGPLPLTESWPSGFEGCDASGGIHTSIPSIRRVGFGICKLDLTPPHSLLAGCWSMLPGHVQTVPRGELFAILTILRHAELGGHYHVFSDSLVNIDLYHKAIKVARFA